MSLISRLIAKLFGKKNQKTEISISPNNDYLLRWEQERQEKIQSAETSLKSWIITSVKENQSLPFSWESGNDEAFVTFQHKTDAEEENFEDLEEYIINKLDIPDAGEFQMNGSGSIYIVDNLVKVKYSSTIKALIDFNENTEEEIYSEAHEDSDDIVLFEV